MDEQYELRDGCQDFVRAAFAVLTEDNVLPTPRYHRHLAVGRDYYGPHLMELTEFKTLEARLNEKYPGRFEDPLSRKNAQFANRYIFSFLEASIARCALTGHFQADSPAIDESITELVSVLNAGTQEVVCVRSVTHLTTASGQEVQIGDIRIIPEHPGRGGPGNYIVQEIPGAPAAWNRELPRRYDPPHALLVTREAVEDPGDFYRATQMLSARLERFLLMLRLLTAGTVQTVFEISGSSMLTSPISPHLRDFRNGTMMGPSLVQRTVALAGDEGQAVEALGKIIDSAEIKREKIVATSLDVALNKFNAPPAHETLFDHLVDLATALEATLIGDKNEGEGLTLRLCSRTAALLAQPDDPGEVVFEDVKQLYQIRSKLVHGGQITEKDLRDLFRKISTMPQHVEGRFGLALAHAVDRMSDLVRRAILARLCLAETPEAKWPFTGNTAVDAAFANDNQRQIWRKLWHDRLTALGSGESANRSRAAVDLLTPEEERPD